MLYIVGLFSGSYYIMYMGNLLKRGGNRRIGHGVAVSHQLTREQCEKLLSATQNAIHSDQPYNRIITIIWGKYGGKDEDTRKHTEAYFKLMRNWANRQGHHISYIAVQEWGEINGGHFHALVHIPPPILEAFGNKRLSHKWAKRVLGLKVAKGISHVDQLYPPKRDISHRGWYDDKLQKNLHYMMKCAPKPLEAEFGMTGWRKKPWGQECPCYGKRIFISQRQRREVRTALLQI